MIDLSAPPGEFLRQIVLVLGLLAVFGAVLATILLVIAAQQIANLVVPPDADFFETLQHVPITVPLALDVLDLAFDIFSAPISWFVLELLGLKALQGITVLEGFIPGTQLIPTMTVAWGISRVMKKRQPQSEARQALDVQYQRLQDRYRQRMLDDGRADELAARYQSNNLLPSSSSYNDIIDGEFFEEEEEEIPEFLDEEDGW